MATFVYTGTESRFYPTMAFGRHVVAGDVLEADENPDPIRFEDGSGTPTLPDVEGPAVPEAGAPPPPTPYVEPVAAEPATPAEEV